MDRRLKNIAVEEQGAVAVIVAIMLTVFIIILAFVADVGYMYEMRRQLQSAADAGALAAMSEKISGADPVTEARAYARSNDLVGTPFRSDILDLANSDFDQEDYVVVAVQKPANLFFAPMFFDGSQMIRAKAKARRVWVSGAKGLLPWGVSVVRATKATATVTDNQGSAISTTELSYNAGNESWEGDLPVPPGSAGEGYPVDITVYNDQPSADYPDGFPTIFSGVGAIFVHPAGDTVSDVSLNRHTLEPGGKTTLSIASTAPPQAKVDRTMYRSSDFSLVGGRYETTITAPPIDTPLITLPIDVSVGSDSYNNAARLVVRDSNSPIDNIDFGLTHFVAAPGQYASISLKMGEFVYGETYNLKVVSQDYSSEVGNFYSLDFRDVLHPTDYTLDHGANDSAADYFDNISGFYPGEIHIGDIIPTLTGNRPEPTENALELRFGDDTTSWDDWVAAGEPASSKRLVLVPVVERIERFTGRSDVIVTEIAVFYIENNPDKTNITGRFVEYARAGAWITDTQPSPLSMQTVRLDRPDY